MYHLIKLFSGFINNKMPIIILEGKAQIKLKLKDER